MVMIKRVGMAATPVAAGALVAVLPGTALGAGAGVEDTEGVTVVRAPGVAQTWTGDVWTVRGCAYGLFLPRTGLSCHHEVSV